MMGHAAEPILASSLWITKPAGESTSAKQRLDSKCKAIDAALQGGFDRGRITCISAEPDAGVRDITQALLVSHLSSCQEATASVIDTGQGMDVKRLFQALVAGSAEQHDLAIAKMKAKQTLDRVRIMKPFDFEGLAEAISELRSVLEGQMPVHEQPPRGTVADSQDDAEEMLDSPTPPPPTAPKPAGNSASTEAKTDSPGSLLIIDSITQLAAPLLKTNHASGQALIIPFMRSLAHLTRAHNLCTIIVNGTISTTTARSNSNYTSKEESPSAFSSCAGRPALGKTWTYLVDIHLLVQRLPKRDRDARRIYGGQRGEGGGRGEMVGVLEVVQDRSAGRVGRWAAFEVDEDGSVRDAF